MWQIEGRTVRLTFTLPLPEALRLAIPAGAEQPPNERIIDYLSWHLTVTAHGRACDVDRGRALSATTQFRRFELVFTCAIDSDIELHSSFYFEWVPSHVTFARIQSGDGRVIEQLFTTDHRDVDATGDEARLRSAPFVQYIVLGIEHILTGPDHMSFLLGLVLISRRLRDLLYVITGFTIGHSVTLALAVTGVLRPHAEFIDALVALTIVTIGAENFVVVTGKARVVATAIALPLLAMAAASFAGVGLLPPLLLLGGGVFCWNYLMLSGSLPDAGRVRLFVTLVFGLIHGFGFAATLLEMELPPARLAQILVGFNIGVELGQLLVVGALLAITAILVRLKFSLPRSTVVDGVAAGLVAVGCFWFVGRSYL